VYSDFSGYSSNVPSGGVENKVFTTDDKVIGAYGEYTYTFDEKVSFVAGLRADYSSQWGWQVAPRASLKYSFTDQTVVRFTGGRGFRTPHVIVDNLGVLSSGRNLKVADNIQAEDAWTFGGNFTQYFRIGDRESNYFSFDYFRSGFNHKVVYDWDSGLANGVVDIYDFNDATAGNNRAFTDTYQVDLSVEPIERFTAIATFRYSNAKISMKNKGLVEAPMTSRYKAVLNLQYAMPMNKWMFDVTAQLNGPCRLPDFMGGGESDIYPMMFAQITKKFSMVDVYAGVENITNYTQKNPIIGAAAPFDRNFNAAMVWGPLMGRMFYIGMRYTMWK
jgi:outer membrane receptor for ferrienterochelin and colicin